MKLVRPIPALPVHDIERATAFYESKLGFKLAYRENGFARLERDAVELHIWAANDDSWRTRSGSEPIVSGAESFIAGTASCRVQVDGVDQLYEAIRPLGILHGCGKIEDQWWGSREFAVVDPDGNLITFFESR